MAQTTFSVDEHTAALLAELKTTFGVKTNAQVIRKALSLARVASDNADPSNRTLTIKSPAGEEKQVLLAG